LDVPSSSELLLRTGVPALVDVYVVVAARYAIARSEVAEEVQYVPSL
jgi:hypothetical protein